MSICEKVAAVITTFNPSSNFRENLVRIAGQVEVVIIVDDSGDLSQEHAKDYADIENATVLRNEDNFGIAATLNRGVAHAESMGYRWVITLDDDTFISETYIDDVFDFIRTEAFYPVGVIACARANGVVERESRNKNFTMKRTLITSGCVFKTETFRDVGGFDENLFIDLVDFDFCTKLRRLGRAIVLLNKVGMNHRVGNSRVVPLLNKNIVIYNHPAFRLYYQMRNIFLFGRKHMIFDTWLCFYLLLDVLRLPVKTLFFEHGKLERFFYLFLGLKDGLLNRGGRLSKRLSCL